MIAPILEGRADVVLGSRLLGGDPRLGGMPWWKYRANRFLTWCENVVFGLRLAEYHTGYRAYTRRALESVDLERNADGFIFDQEIVAQMVESRARLMEVAVPTRYFPEASSASFRASVIYGLGILALLLRYTLHRLGLWRQARFTAHAARYHQA